VRPYAYYPGCSLQGTAKEYEASLRAIAGPLAIELHELPGWTCCGSSAAHATSHLLAIALAGRNLNLAAQTSFAVPSGHGAGLLVPCAACYSRLRGALVALNGDAALREQFAQVAAQPWTGGNVVVKSLVEVLAQDLGPAEIAARIVRPLTGIKVASYYGCLLLRPTTITGFDDPETPSTLDSLVAATGAAAIPWSHKTECCGAGLSISKRDVVGRLVGDILSAALDAGAQAIVTACPMCHANLDTRQDIAGKATGRRFGLPILYVTQLIGLALGLTPRQLSLRSHVTPVDSLLAAIHTGATSTGEVT
jgi:heterodisulfide reductase subunit B